MLQKKYMKKLPKFDYLMSLIKGKVLSCKTYREKIQYLSLRPCEWSIDKCSEYFQVSQYLIQKSRDFAKGNGVLYLTLLKKDKSVSHEMKEEIVLCYEDDKISRIIPRKKDYVSIGRNIHTQKSLLANLKELHPISKSKYPPRQIGFSKFCSLHPKWCVLPGSSGTHSVCACTHHQNMKLILAPLGVSHTELCEFLICDINSKVCILHRCPNCPENTEMLESKLYELTGHYDDETVIEFNQWASTDSANLIPSVKMFLNL